MSSGGQTGTAVSTSGDITLSYVTLAEAQTYFNSRLDTDDWTDATEADKIKSLVMATIAIDRLNYLGSKTDSAQTHQFPRYDDSAVPQDVKDAVCEEALLLAGGKTLELEREAARMRAQTFGAVKTVFEVDMAALHLSAGLVSSTAFDILQPYLRPSGDVDVIRL